MRVSLFLLLGLIAPATAAAADYRVDLIVVVNRKATPEAMAAARSPGSQLDARAIDLADKAGLRRAGITLLSGNQLGLAEEWQRLRNSHFRPVLRLSWLQAPKPTATALRLRDDFRWLVSASPPTTNEASVMPAVAPVERYRLDGSVLLQQSAGLRVSFTLDYHWPRTTAPSEYPKAGAPVPIGSADLFTVSMHGEKRVNLNQNYFFDHPVLGVLLRVSPG